MIDTVMFWLFIMHVVTGKSMLRSEKFVGQSTSVFYRDSYSIYWLLVRISEKAMHIFPYWSSRKPN